MVRASTGSGETRPAQPLWATGARRAGLALVASSSRGSGDVAGSSASFPRCLSDRPTRRSRLDHRAGANARLASSASTRRRAAVLRMVRERLDVGRARSRARRLEARHRLVARLAGLARRGSRGRAPCLRSIARGSLVSLFSKKPEPAHRRRGKSSTKTSVDRARSLKALDRATLVPELVQRGTFQSEIPDDNALSKAVESLDAAEKATLRTTPPGSHGRKTVTAAAAVFGQGRQDRDANPAAVGRSPLAARGLGVLRPRRRSGLRRRLLRELLLAHRPRPSARERGRGRHDDVRRRSARAIDHRLDSRANQSLQAEPRRRHRHQLGRGHQPCPCGRRVPLPERRQRREPRHVGVPGRPTSFARSRAVAARRARCPGFATTAQGSTRDVSPTRATSCASGARTPVLAARPVGL